MHQQFVKGPKLDGFKGFAYILGMAALVYLFSLAMQAAVKATGMAGLQILSLVFAIVAVVFVMHNFVAEYRYTLSDGSLVLERTMGSTHGRVLYALPVTDLIALGEEEDMKRQFANAHFERLTLDKNPLPVRALAFRKDGKNVLVRLQMEAEFEQALREAVDAAQCPETV